MSLLKIKVNTSLLCCIQKNLHLKFFYRLQACKNKEEKEMRKAYHDALKRSEPKDHLPKKNFKCWEAEC